MIYLKEYLKAFRNNVVCFGVMFFIVSVLEAKSGFALYCAWLCAFVSLGGPLRVLLDKIPEKAKNEG